MSTNLFLGEGNGDLTITPYGSLWGSLRFVSDRTNTGPFTLWVFSEQDHGEPAMEIDARRTRVGIDVAGQKFRDSGYQLGGKVEADFFGQFLTENRAGARLRHGYFEAKNEEWRFLVGQTWDVVSPLRPGMLNFTGTWAAGNIGYRRAQFRVERTLSLENDTQLLFQGSINQDIVDDFPTDAGVRRETADIPVFQARSAVELGMVDGKAVVLGISGHYGETGFDFIQTGPPPLNLPPTDDARFTTWSINLDWEVPLSSQLTMRGEVFRGANLSPYLGGIGQGVCPCLRKSIRSTGGWTELVWAWSPMWESHCGLGIDDPNDSDSLVGRVQNEVVFGNLILHMTENLSTGCELAYWRTLYQDQRRGQIPVPLLTPSAPGKALTLEWMVRYDF
ncbi:MAG: hypothetical protein KDA84_01215 [Planctomycetaceae bacterium]|nr:hypothetical protein [Planctomycetaceae bacterium]